MPGRWIITNLNKISKYQSLHLLLNALNHFLVWCPELVLTASQLNSHESCQCDKIESVPPIIIPAAEYLISLIANIRAGWRADRCAIVQRLTLVFKRRLLHFPLSDWHVVYIFGNMRELRFLGRLRAFVWVESCT